MSDASSISETRDNFSSLEKQSFLTHFNKYTKNHPSKHILVAGAGLGGLICAYRLLQAGYYVTLLEVGDYIGGRIMPMELGKTGHIVNAGAEIIDPHDDDMIELIHELGLKLIDRTAIQPDREDGFYLGGKHYRYNDLLDTDTQKGDYAKLRSQIIADEALIRHPLTEEWTEHAKYLDSISAEEYLRSHAHLAPDWVVSALRQALLSEMGCSLDNLSALLLVDFVEVEPLSQRDIPTLYDSDERYTIEGGVYKIIQALFEKLKPYMASEPNQLPKFTLQMRSSLIEVFPSPSMQGGKIVKLNLMNQGEYIFEFDAVICAMPANALSKIKGLQYLGLDSERRHIVKNISYNKWIKISFQTLGNHLDNSLPWQNVSINDVPSSGSFVSDTIFQTCWTNILDDGTGIVTMLIGGQDINIPQDEWILECQKAYAKSLGKSYDSVFDLSIPPALQNWNILGGCSPSVQPNMYISLSQMSKKPSLDPRVALVGNYIMDDNMLGFLENTARSARNAVNHIISGLLQYGFVDEYTRV